MGRLKDKDWFKETKLTKLHKELLIRCLEHGFYWAENLIGLSFAEKWYAGIMRPFYKLFVRIVMQKARKVEAI
jgi:hypothetical protein